MLDTKLQSILSNWPIIASSAQQSTKGLINSTYWIESERGQLILQKLHRAVNSTGHRKNFEQITSWLAHEKFPAPLPLETKKGGIWVKHDNEHWRLMVPVAGEVRLTISAPAQAHEIGKLIGRFHDVTRGLESTLVKGHVGFVFPKYLSELARVTRNSLVKDRRDIRSAVELITTNLRKIPLHSKKRHVIHGDTKVSNVVFKDDKAIALIDLDTTQINSPLFDLADAARSACSLGEQAKNNEVHPERFAKLVEGYAAATNTLSKEELMEVPNALALVTAGLAARFFIDYVDDCYFGWDPNRYKSRREHNLARAINQLQLHQSVVGHFGLNHL